MFGGKGVNGGGGVYNYFVFVGNVKFVSVFYVESMVLNGNGGMFGFVYYFSDEQVVKIVNYVCIELNNNQDQVKFEDFKQICLLVEREMIFGEDVG